MKKLFSIIAIITFLGSVTLAGTFENTEIGLSIWVPDDWETMNDQGMLTADSPEGDAFFSLEVLDNVNDLETALTAYQEILDTYFENFITEGEPAIFKLNDLDIEGLSGSGMMDGERWGVDIMLISTGEGVCICISAVAESSGGAYDKIFEEIAASLRKI